MKTAYFVLTALLFVASFVLSVAGAWVDDSPLKESLWSTVGICFISGLALSWLSLLIFPDKHAS